MYNFREKTIREIALDLPSTIRVFQNHKIDFCCGGRIAFPEACETAGVDPQVLLADLEAATKSPDTSTDFSAQKAAELIDHIVCTHHVFTRNEVERLIPLADKVASRHGETHPELIEIRDIVHTLGSELIVHMQKEEMILFPYIERLERPTDANRVPTIPPFGTVNNPVRMMMYEHDQAGGMLRQLRSLSMDYTAPEGACPSYKGLFSGLDDLEKDLHQHIHLENNILFPRAEALEKQAFSVSSAAVGG